MRLDYERKTTGRPDLSARERRFWIIVIVVLLTFVTLVVGFFYWAMRDPEF